MLTPCKSIYSIPKRAREKIALFTRGVHRPQSYRARRAALRDS